MKLAELDPKWLHDDAGHRIGLAFRCPFDLSSSNPRVNLQTCFFGKTPRQIQYEATNRAGLEMKRGVRVQHCNPDHGWSCTPPVELATFDNISITPSIDGSRGGNWHGFITNGAIV